MLVLSQYLNVDIMTEWVQATIRLNYITLLQCSLSKYKENTTFVPKYNDIIRIYCPVWTIFLPVKHVKMKIKEVISCNMFVVKKCGCVYQLQTSDRNKNREICKAERLNQELISATNTTTPARTDDAIPVKSCVFVSYDVSAYYSFICVCVCVCSQSLL